MITAVFLVATVLGSVQPVLATGTGGLRHGRHLRIESAPANDASVAVKRSFPFYHTSNEIHAEAVDLASRCNGALSIQTVTQDDVSIDVASVKRVGSNPANKMFILFGEHSRELISPESGLHLLKVLCGEAQADGNVAAADVLADSEFQMVLNGNPRSRAKVEDGAYCLRVNPNGVDLNRNWDEKWSPEATNVIDTDPGPKPFSEPETRIFKRLVSDYKPTTFLTVHSGTRGMYMPWAYDTEHMGTRNQQSMIQILKDTDQEHCQCPYGAAGKEVGYACPGTCLDWVYDNLQTPYVFAVEIYTSPERDSELQARWQDKVQGSGAAFLQNGTHLAHSHFIDLFQKHTSDFVHTRAHHRHTWDDDAESCFGIFNPDSQERFDATVSNWAGAYLEMAQKVAADVRNKK